MTTATERDEAEARLSYCRRAGMNELEMAAKLAAESAFHLKNGLELLSEAETGATP